MKRIECTQNKADSFLYLMQTITIWLLQIDNYLYYKKKEDAIRLKEKIVQKIEYDDIGKLKKYIGFKIERKKIGSGKMLILTI